MNVTIIKLCVALVIFALIINRVGFVSITDVAAGANPVYLGLAFLVLVCSLLLDCVNLNILLRPLARIRMRRLFKTYLFGWALGLVTPGKVGEFAISFFLRDKIEVGKTAAVYALDKATTILVLILFSMLGMALFLDPTTAWALSATFIGLWIAGVAVIFSDRGRALVRRLLRGRAELFAGFAETFISYLKTRKRYVAGAVALAATRWVLNVIVVLLVFLSVGQPVPFLILLAIVPLSSLASILPITFSGLGVREGVFIFLTAQAGIASSVSTTVSLFLLMIDYSLVLVTLLVLVKQVDVGALLREVRGSQAPHKERA
ncbi:MAG: flippase-like domain-containing protein [Candidatus Aenigmarchaeota archaeon]|nr:flippase-like domain-containing protein [Candidatus Aenigmarchaeota archaeon]